MSKVLITEGHLENIAGSIRRKKGTGETYKVSEMSAAIDSIPTADTTTKNITANGTYNAYNTDSVAGYSQVTVAVPTPTMAPKTITANGTYSPQSDGVSGYNSVLVNVQKEITAADNGKVVVNGFLTAQTSRSVTENGTYNTTQNNTVSVNVPNTYGTSDEGKVVSGSALVSQTSRNVDANGTYTTTTNNEVVVAVPNSYQASDEGKVVSDGALVPQTSRSVTENGTYDTTTNNSVSVAVASNLGTKNITVNGTYPASSDSLDGYSEVTVDIGGGEEVTKQYVDDAIKNVLGDIATYEETSTATVPHAVGSYVMLSDGKFYPVTAAIAVNDTIEAGVNIGTATTVGAEIATLNNNLMNHIIFEDKSNTLSWQAGIHGQLYGTFTKSGYTLKGVLPNILQRSSTTVFTFSLAASTLGGVYMTTNSEYDETNATVSIRLIWQKNST